MASKVLIVGQGLAAFAAVKSLDAQVDVMADITLIASSRGATFMNSGALNFYPVSIEESLENRGSLDAFLRELHRINPEHPYVKLLNNQNIDDSNAADLLSSLNIDFVGSIQKTGLFINSMGLLKTAQFVQSTQAGLNFVALKAAKIAVVGIQSYKDFDAGFIEKSLKHYQNNLLSSQISSVSSMKLDLDLKKGSEGWNSYELAHAFEKKEFRNKFVEKLVKKISAVLATTDTTHVLLPPVMGLEHSQEILDKIQEKTGLICAEAIATHQSVPGLRLHLAIQKYFQNKNIKLIQGQVTGAISDSDYIQQIEYDIPEEENKKMEVDQVILCSGKFLSSGLVANPKIEEAIFNLPLFTSSKSSANLISHQTVPRLLKKNPEAEQDIFSLGLRINSDSQVLDLDQEPVYSNLRAAGSVLSSYDVTRLDCSGGVALLSGFKAGEQVF